MEQARETLASERLITPRWQRAALSPLSQPTMLKLGSAAQVADICEGLPLGPVNNAVGAFAAQALYQPEAQQQ